MVSPRIQIISNTLRDFNVTFDTWITFFSFIASFVALKIKYQIISVFKSIWGNEGEGE